MAWAMGPDSHLLRPPARSLRPVRRSRRASSTAARPPKAADHALAPWCGCRGRCLDGGGGHPGRASRAREAVDGDRFWRDYCDAGPAVTAVVAVALKFIGKLDDGRPPASCLSENIDSAREGVPVLSGGNTGDLAATAACYARARRGGRRRRDPRAVAATNVDRHQRRRSKLIDSRAPAISPRSLSPWWRGGRTSCRARRCCSASPRGGVSPRPAVRVPGPFPGVGLRRDRRVPPQAAAVEPELRAAPPAPPVRRAHHSTEFAPARRPAQRPAAGRTDFASTQAEKVTQSGADLASNLVKGTARTPPGRRPGGIDRGGRRRRFISPRPVGIGGRAVRGALETGRAVTSGAAAR